MMSFPLQSSVRLSVTLALLAGVMAAAEPSPAGLDAWRQLLLVAEDRAPQAVTLAGRKYQNAIGQRSDGSVEYAYAIVLLRLNKPKEALTLLAKSAEWQPKPYLPGARALIALSLQQKQGASTATRMEQFAGWLTDTPAHWETAAGRETDAHWLGRAVSAAQLVTTDPKEVQRFAEVDRRLRGKLTAGLLAPYRAGFDAVVDESEQLAEATAAADVIAREKQVAEQEAERDNVRDRQRLTQSSRENLKLTAEEWKKQLDEKLAEFGKQLGLMEKSWTGLDQRRQSIEHSILLAQQEQQLLLGQYQQLAQNNNNRNNGRDNFQARMTSTAMQRLDREMGIRQEQIFAYEQDRQRTLNSMGAVYQQAQLALQQRQSLVADYERGTGQLVKQDESLKKWNERLQKQEQELAEGPKGKAPSVQTLEQRRKSVSNYLPMDWEAERQRLLGLPAS
jgi:hypothetical protein